MQKELTREELEKRVQELEQTVRVLKEDLIHDSLTGLKTRKYFNEEAKKFYDTAISAQQSTRKEWFGIKHLSFIFFDIDHFKKVNDEHGHIVGDAVLKAVSHEILNGVRNADIVARWGGEEIIVALIGAREKEASKKADAIRRSIEKMFFNELPGIKVTVSAGVASSEIRIPYEEAIRSADEALYEAKNTGRNKVVLYSEISK